MPRAGKIASGDLAGGVPVNGSDEIASLAAAFNAMTANVKGKKRGHYRKRSKATLAYKQYAGLHVDGG